MLITESFAMWPGASVSGLYFAHPASRYFGAGGERRTRGQRCGDGLSVTVVDMAAGLQVQVACDTLSHMKQVNVRELHARTGAIVDLAAKGRIVTIVKRGRPVAELRPLDDGARQAALPDRTALLKRFPKLRGDSGRFLEEDRS